MGLDRTSDAEIRLWIVRDGEESEDIVKQGHRNSRCQEEVPEEVACILARRHPRRIPSIVWMKLVRLWIQELVYELRDTSLLSCFLSLVILYSLIHSFIHSFFLSKTPVAGSLVHTST